MNSDNNVNLEIENMAFTNKWIGTRVRNALQGAGIRTLGELLERTPEELRGIPHFGAISLAEVVAKLDSMGLKLRDQSW